MFEHHLAGIGDSLRSFANGVEAFASNLAGVEWDYLTLGLALHGAFLALYSRAWFKVIQGDPGRLPGGAPPLAQPLGGLYGGLRPETA